MSLPKASVGRNSVPFQQNLPDKETLWQQTYLEAFHRNYDSVQRWTRWKDDHEHVKCALETLPNKLSHEVVIPFGSKALMKAKLVHTNEILTCIGGSYFVKQTAKQGVAMCERRIKQSEEMLSKLETERTLLSNRQTVPKLEEAFPNDDTKEIIEEYNEEAEAEWRRQHREREAEYRRKLSELRKVQVEKPPLQTEEDIFRRLDELELEEELNDELERLHAEYEADYENNDEEDEGESSEDEEDNENEDDESLASSPEQDIGNPKSELPLRKPDSKNPSDYEKTTVESSGPENYRPLGIPNYSLSPSCREAWTEETPVDFEALKKTRRISFADEASQSKLKNNVEEEASIYIRFNHSEQPSYVSTGTVPEATPPQDQEKPKYLTPADIYNKHKILHSPQPKSILKKSSSYPEKFQGGRAKPIQASASFGSCLGITFADSKEEDGGPNYQPVRDLSHLPPVLCDVQESATSASQSNSQETSQRPVSRFKQARQKRQ
ncbi:hypothetical protein ONE63_011060 [Megalurothrips usitatus]|uniref:Unconventional prefoldin RPB5 interactor n=1 Tax=Megalurothrips usitatus TaxID=439358 RepID=A0AAV7XLS6_9NEOP|nr:hypothetical protein ONE63_011060 [Megalurothrips usitatus]